MLENTIQKSAHDFHTFKDYFLSTYYVSDTEWALEMY